jgi:hypothetical protein
MPMLYHATSLENLVSILHSNVLYGTDDYDFGVATSRDKDYLFLNHPEHGDITRGGADVQIILDRNKIKAKYKIEAFDWEEWKHSTNINYRQSEDKILTKSIENIRKYIIGIHINKNVENTLQTLVSDIAIKDMIVNNKWSVFDTKWNIIIENGII